MIDLVLYHANCRDGFCAAWLLHEEYPEAEYVAVNYGQEPPDVTNKDTLIVDFSYKRDILLAMKAKAASLLVLDHHKTAQADLEGLNFCKFDMTKSGARLTYEYLNRRVENWLVDYTEDRDLWLWKLPFSKEVSAALASYPMDFGVWDELYQFDKNKLISQGDAILRVEGINIKHHVERATLIQIDGYIVPVVNATCLFSEIAGKLAEREDFGVVWFVRDNKIQFSLRSRKGTVDVSAIAKKYGGGGHQNAAGFELPIHEGIKLFYPEI